jgi:hypothetical protein
MAAGMAVTVLLGIVLPQTGANRPLTVNQVKDFWKYDNKNFDNQIKAAGVDFELDYPTIESLRSIGMKDAQLDLIRQQIRTGTIIVRCEPIECDVTINNDVVGKTYAAELSRSGILAGLVRLKVSAPNYDPQTADVQLTPGQHLTRSFVLEQPKGRVEIACKPQDSNEEKTMPECAIHVSGPNGFVKIGTTAQHQLNVDGLTVGQYQVQAQAVGYKAMNAPVYVNAARSQPLAITLPPDECGRMTPLQMFDGVVYALGGKDALTVGATSKNRWRMTLTGDPAAIGNWNAQVTEYVTREPNRMRWDLKIGGSNWAVGFDGSKTWSNGDKRYKGTDFAQELEQSVRFFSELRLSSVLPTVRGRTDIKHTCTDTGYVMVGESAEDRYTFQLNKDFQPKTLLREHLTPPKSSQEVEFGQYKKVGDLKLPHVMILRYPGRPKHEQIVEYDQIELGVPIKDSVFKP